MFARKVLCAFPPPDGGFVFVDEGGFFVVVGHFGVANVRGEGGEDEVGRCEGGRRWI